MNVPHTWSLPKLRGVPIGVHWSALAAVGLFTMSIARALSFTDASPVTRWAVAGVCALALVAGVLAHELGHVAAAWRCGAKVHRVTLWALGGAAEIEGPFRSPGAAFGVAVAGPAVSLVAAGGCVAAGVAASAAGAPEVVVAALAWLTVVNVVVAAFNMLPVSPLDGGRAVAAVLWKLSGNRVRAELWTASAGRALGYGMAGLGIWGVMEGRPTLWWVLLGLFISSNANREAVLARLELAAEGRTVADVTAPLAPPVARGVTLHGLTAMGLDGAWVPVGSPPALTVLAPAEVQAVPPAMRASVNVEAVARPVSPEPLDPAMPLRHLFEEVGVPGPDSPLFVVSDGAGGVAGVLDPSRIWAAAGR